MAEALVAGLAREAKVDWSSIDELTEKLKATDKGATACADAIEEELKKKGLIYESVLPPEQVGPHPRNRDISVCEIGPLMEDISYGGFSHQRCKHALACEERPGCTEIEDYNIALSEGTPVLAAVCKGDIKVGSLACSHMNLGLRAINARAECTAEELAEDGQWSVDRIAARPFGQQFLQALKEGIRWKILRWVVYHERPELLGLLSAQRNMEQHTGRAMSEASVLQELFRLAAASQAPDWPRIKRVVLRSRPPCAGIVDDLAYFALRRSGGAQGPDMNEWVTFFHRFAGSRKIPGPVYAAAANIDLYRVSFACLKALASCPKERVEQGVCKWFNPQEILALAKEDNKKKDLVDLAETLMEESRELLASAGLRRDETQFKNELCENFCFLDCGIARVLLNKVEGTEKVVDAGVRILDSGGANQAFPPASSGFPLSGNGCARARQVGPRACFILPPPSGASVAVRQEAGGAVHSQAEVERRPQFQCRGLHGPVGAAAEGAAEQGAR